MCYILLANLKQNFGLANFIRVVNVIFYPSDGFL